MGVFPGPIFPDDVFPDPIFPGGGEGEEVTPVQVGDYRHVAPGPIERRATVDLYTLARTFEAMED